MFEIVIVKPSSYDEKKMTYDYNTHKFVLNLAIVNELDGRYKDETTAKRRLTSISNAVYRYIYNHSNSNNQAFLELYLNCTKQGQELIFNAMYLQLLADLETGYEDIAKQNLIDFASGNYIPREVVQLNRLCVDSQAHIESCNTPINVLYAGVFPQAYKYANMTDRYERYDY